MFIWDQRYCGNRFVYGTAPNDFLAQQAHRITDGPVLCLAEGEGRNAVFLAQQGHEVHAVDLSRFGRAKAMGLAEKAGVSIHYDVGDLAHLDMGEERWQAVISVFAHTSSTLRRAIHQKVVAGLKPGGVFILEAFSPDQLDTSGTGGPKNPDMLVPLGDVQQELAELDLIIARETLRSVDEGELHRGECSVVQIVGIKPAT